MKKYVKKIKFINDFYTKYKWRERKISRGNENPDITFYVIRRSDSNVGLFSLVLTTLGYIKYALEKGYIPVVDLTNDGNAYLDQQAGSNVWEYYFEQPCGYSLKDIENSKNIILGNGIIDWKIPFPTDRVVFHVEEENLWRETAQKYLRIKSGIQNEMRELKENLLGKDQYLGVLLRGTDYVNVRPKNHPIQPTVEEAIQEIDRVLWKNNYDKIYLATEDKEIHGKMKKKYGERLISMDVERYVTKNKENINEISVKKSSSRYQMGKEYLINILILSESDYLLAGNTSGSQGALLLRRNDKERYFFDLGKY